MQGLGCRPLMNPPQIIFLNGTSSAGKSSLAKALQANLSEPYLHFCIDAFEEMMPNRPDFEWLPIFTKTLSGMHHSIVAMADCGNRLIVDHVLVEGEAPLEWVPECLRLLARFDILFVGVQCPLPILRVRETTRKDRKPGMAEWQSTRMHLKMQYDVDVNTAALSPQDCALQVIDAFKIPRTGWNATLSSYGLRK